MTYDHDASTVVLAFRGTNGVDYSNWASNIMTFPREVARHSGIKIHAGYYEAYEAVQNKVR